MPYCTEISGVTWLRRVGLSRFMLGSGLGSKIEFKLADFRSSSRAGDSVRPDKGPKRFTEVEWRSVLRSPESPGSASMSALGLDRLPKILSRLPHKCRAGGALLLCGSKLVGAGLWTSLLNFSCTEFAEVRQKCFKNTTFGRSAGSPILAIMVTLTTRRD